MSIENTLADRGKQYGHVHMQADIFAQALGSAWPHLSKMNPTQRQSVVMIALKLSRVLAGNPNHADSWRDIEGYARLAREAIPAEADE